MKVVIIGSGNVATVLSIMIHRAGHEIAQIVSRNEGHAKALALKAGTEGVALTEPEFAEADIYIIALNDAALESIEKIKGLKHKFIVHTAGSVSKDVLKNLSSEYGVLYPLQSLSNATNEIPEVPFLIEGNSSKTTEKLTEFARTLSTKVVLVTEQERLHYHVAAVFAGNFTNHLYAIAENFCGKERIDFKNLLPMIVEITSRLNNHSPRDVQTGPAIREDIFTINRHLQALSPHPDIKYLYLKLTESILKLYEKR